MKDSQKGFIVPLLLLIVAVLLIGGGAYVYMQKKQGNPRVTGNLSLAGTVATGLHPSAIVVSPDGTSVYVANEGLTPVKGGLAVSTSSISEYARNTSTGTIVPLGAVTVSAEEISCPTDLTISPDGTSVYAVCKDFIYEYSRNISTGILTPLGSTPFMGGDVNAIAVAISPDGHFVYEATVTNSGPPDDTQVGNIYEYVRNTTTGVLTAVANPVTAGIIPQSIIISPDGTSVYVYAANSPGSSGNEILEYSRNTSIGDLTQLTKIATEGGYYGMYSMSISPDGTSVYVTNNDNTAAVNKGTVSEYARNTLTGVLTSTGVIAAGWNPYGIVVSPDGTSVYASTEVVASTTGNQSGVPITSQAVSEYTRDSSSGVLSFLHTTITPGTGSENIAISPDGTSLYVTDTHDNIVYEYSRH